MTMPGDIRFNSGTTYFGKNLTDAVERGEISEERVDDMGMPFFELDPSMALT